MDFPNSPTKQLKLNKTFSIPVRARDTEAVAMLIPKKNRMAICELLFKEGTMVAKDAHRPKHPQLADKNVPNLHVGQEGQTVSQIRRLRKGRVGLEPCLLILTKEGIQYLRDYLHLPHPRPQIEQDTSHCSGLETAGQGPKIWRASKLQNSLEGKLTDPSTDRVLCFLVPTRKLRPQLGQQPNFSLEANLVVDVVNYLSKVGAIIWC